MTIIEVLDGLAELGRLRLERERAEAAEQDADAPGRGDDGDRQVIKQRDEKCQ